MEIFDLLLAPVAAVVIFHDASVLAQYAKIKLERSLLDLVRSQIPAATRECAWSRPNKSMFSVLCTLGKRMKGAELVAGGSCLKS